MRGGGDMRCGAQARQGMGHKEMMWCGVDVIDCVACSRSKELGFGAGWRRGDGRFPTMHRIAGLLVRDDLIGRYCRYSTVMP